MISKAQLLSHLDTVIYPQLGHRLAASLGVNFFDGPQGHIRIGARDSISEQTLRVPVTRFLMMCHDYAAQGIWDLEAPEPAEVHITTQEFIAGAHGFDRVHEDFSMDELQELMDITLARWKVDYAEAGEGGPLTFREVALLSGMAVQSVKNAIAAGEFRSDRGFIAVQDVFPWLLSKGYKPTLWLQRTGERTYTASIGSLLATWFRNVDDVEKLLGRRVSEVSARELLNEDSTELAILCKALSFSACYIRAHVEALERLPTIRAPGLSVDEQAASELVAVPQAKDGSLFTPQLARRSGFRIGRKGEEFAAPTFEGALRELRRMNTPYWRRPSATSPGWGIVKGVHWVDVPIRELERNTGASPGASRQAVGHS